MTTFSSNCSPGRYPFSLPTTNTFVENIPLSTSQQVKGTVSGDFSTLFLLFQLGPISCAKPVLLTLLFSHILYTVHCTVQYSLLQSSNLRVRVVFDHVEMEFQSQVTPNFKMLNLLPLNSEYQCSSVVLQRLLCIWVLS